MTSQTDQIALPKVFSEEERLLGLQKRRETIAQWKKLSLRQDWVDEDYMRSFLSKAGLRINTYEPASVTRMQTFLHKAGYSVTKTQAAIGLSLDNYLAKNPSLPLWVALAFVLEALSLVM